MAQLKHAQLQRECRSWRSGTVIAFCLLSLTFQAFGADWQATITKDPPGKFSSFRPMCAKYNFGWGGFTAAIGETHFTKTSGDRYLLEATGRSIGLVRALWRFDVNYRGLT